MVLKIVPEAGHDVHIGKIDLQQRSKDGNISMEVKKSWTLILTQLSEQYLELVSVFKEASRDFMLLFISEKTTKKFRNHCACTESYQID